MPARSRWLKLSAVTVVLSMVMAASAPFFSHVTQRHNPSGAGLDPLGAMVVFLILCFANHLRVRRGKPPFTTQVESISCFIVLMVGGWAAGWGFADTIIPLLTSPYVFGSPENGWVTYILPHLPNWALGPADEPYASAFYMGLRTGIPIPWGMWIAPTLVWTGFAFTLAAAGFGISAILSRQWIEHDRLAFPHAEIVLGTCRGFMASPGFWWAFAVAGSIPVWNDILHPLAPVLPKINLTFGGGAVEWFKDAWKVTPFLNVGLLGIFYFVHRDIVISIVIFFFVLAMESYGLGIAGAKLEDADLLNGSIMEWQNAGALFALVGFGLWAGRNSLVRLFQDGIRGRDDGSSWLSPRAALIFVGIGIGGGVIWMMLLGLRSPGPLAALTVSHVVSMIGMARVMMESGFGHQWPIMPNDFAILVGGTAAIAPAGFVALALAQGWLANGWGTHFALGVHADKLRSQFKFPRAVLVTALIAMILSTVAVFYSTAWLCYDRGANNFGGWSYKWHMRIPYDSATDVIRGETVPPDPKRFGWLGVGVVLMGGLIMLRNHVVGWFLHPVGFLLAPMGIPPGKPGNEVIFTAALVWIIKTLILRLGGVESYEKFKPIFAGLVLGHFMPNFIALILDVIWFINTGHKLQ